MRRTPSTTKSLCAALLAASLAASPTFAWTGPKGATPVQHDDVDLDDLFVDEDGDDFDDMPDGDGDMPMGDYDLEHGVPEPEPEPEPPPRRTPPPPVEPVREPPPERRLPPSRGSDTPRRMLLDGDPPPRSGGPRVPLTETEEIGTIDTEEPEEGAGNSVVMWTVAGVGAAVGVAALVGAGFGAYVLFGGLGGPTGTVTVTPH